MEYSSSSSDEDDADIEAVFYKESFLPSIGPPKVLQYVKESVNPPFTNEFSDRERSRSCIPKAEHACVFCQTQMLEKFDVMQHMSLVEAVSVHNKQLIYLYISFRNYFIFCPLTTRAEPPI